MKKIVFILIAVTIFVTVIAMKPKSVNVPPGHDTYGELPKPLPKFEPVDPPEVPFFTITNESGCKDIILQFWLTGKTIESGEETTVKIEIDPVTGMITNGNIMDAFHAVFGVVAFTVSNVSFDVLVNNQSYGYFMYPQAPFNSQVYANQPGEEKPRPKPCDCIRIDFNYEAKTILITRPVPPCEKL